MSDDTSSRLLLIGHSHLQCVAAAQTALGEGAPRLDAVRLFKDKRSGHEPDFDAYLDRELQALGLPTDEPADVVGLFMGGNTHNTLGLVQMKPPFDYVLSEHPDLPLFPGAALVPERVVHEILATRMEAPLRGLDKLARRFGARAVCVESPPPLGNDDYVRQHLDAHFQQEFAQGRDIVPATQRFKLWRTSCAIFRNRCQASGLEYLPTPPEAMEVGMYLRPEAYPLNATHGNSWFGGHLLNALIARAARLRASGLPPARALS